MKITLNPKRHALLGSTAFIIGLLGMGVSLYLSQQPTYAQNTPYEQEAATPPVTPQTTQSHAAQPSPAMNNNVVSGHPTHITIASVGINVPIIDGSYDPKTNAWTLTKTNAQFAVASVQPNTKSGTTYIYGHDTMAVFHPLQKAQPGAIAAVTTDNGYKFVYALKDSVVTTPYAVDEVTAPSGTPQLSLQTCYGPTSADRRIFHFDFVRVEKM